jgi:hypothetical protein
MTRTATLLLLLAALGCGPASAAPEYRDGDLVFQTTYSSQSVAVQRATHSPYSHMGMIMFRGRKPFVFEAYGTVSATTLDNWCARGVGEHYVVKRLRDAASRLTPDAVSKMRTVLQGLMGKAYDLTFEWNDSRIYCSELVWKVYDRALGVRIGELQKLHEFDLTDPAVKAKLRERYGDAVPLDEPVISPAAMFASPLLEVVVER